MKSDKNPIFIGLAWPYVNGNLHVGHLAGYLLPADIFARFSRLRGHDVLMVSGSDCFGTPITLEADKRHISPADVVNEHHTHHLELFKKAGITYDLYTKTDTDNHHHVTQAVFVALAKNGYIFTDTTAQYYSPSDDKFLPDRYVEGTCPKCHTPGARSDQCDSCGSPLDQGELIDPVSKLTGEKVELKDSEHYFLNWPKLQPFLQEFVEASTKKNPWRTWVENETRGWLKTGLQPRAITRDLDWGIPIPTDQLPPELVIKNHDQKRIYVWFDAVIGYLSAAIEWAKGSDRWEHFWKNPSATHYYFMGKDNLIFHTLFWPGQLHGYDETLNLPDVPAINQYLNLGNKKFSKGKGVIIDSQELIDTYGVDAVRFYLASIMPEHADTAFTLDDFVAKTNNVLIGTIGNFINRTATLAKDFPAEFAADPSADYFTTIAGLITTASDHLQKVEFRTYLEAVIQIAEWGNKYLAETKPWSLDRASTEFADAITPAVTAVVGLVITLQPLLPHIHDKLEALLNITLDSWPDDVATTLATLTQKVHITDVQPLFNRIEL